MRMWASLAIVMWSACGAVDGCAGEPLPEGGIPPTQVIEGGLQVRFGTSAATHLASRVEPVIRDVDPECIPRTSSGDVAFTGAVFCDTNQAATSTNPDVCGAQVGCNMALSIDPGVTFTTQANNIVRLTMSIDAQAIVHMTGNIVSVPFSCDATATYANQPVTVDVRLSVDATGAITTSVVGFVLNAPALTQCSFIVNLPNVVANLNAAMEFAVYEQIEASVEAAVRDLVSSDAQLAARIGLSNVLDDIDDADDNAALEVSAAAGGIAFANVGGFGFGVNFGVNSDADPTTREPTTASEPAACAAHLTPPDLAAPPYALTQTPRQTFALAPMVGTPEAGRDVVLGMSEKSLDLLAHHLAASGALCLSTNQAQFSQLTTGILSALVPSLLGVGTGEEPLQIIGRPGRSPDVTLATTSSGKPRLVVSLDEYVLEIHATLPSGDTHLATLTTNVTLALDPVLVQNPGERAALSLLLADVTATNATVTDIDASLTESTLELGAVLPSALNLIVPPLVGDVPLTPLATITGFDLDAVELSLLAPANDFLLLRGDIATLTAPTPSTDAPLTPTIDSVDVPSADTIRDALAGEQGASLPTIRVALPSGAQSLEWTWRIDHGTWRPFAAQPEQALDITDVALAWQGRHSLTFASRPAGTNGAWTPTADLDVVIDSVGPRILAAEIAWNDDVLSIPAVDAVYGRDELEWGYARAGNEPTTWRDVATISRADLGTSDTVFVRDPQGNVSSTTIESSTSDDAGCCAAQTSPASSLCSLVLLLVLRRRRR